MSTEKKTFHTKFSRGKGLIEAKVLCLMIKLLREIPNEQSGLAPSLVRWNKWAKRMQYPHLIEAA